MMEKRLLLIGFLTLAVVAEGGAPIKGGPANCAKCDPSLDDPSCGADHCVYDNDDCAEKVSFVESRGLRSKLDKYFYHHLMER